MCPEDTTQIHVWHVIADVSPNQRGFMWQLLTDDEIESARRFKFEPERNLLVSSHGALRCILARYCGTSPRNIRFSFGQNGKPELKRHEQDIAFNLSHSGNRALIAITNGRSSGIDTERIRREVATVDIARRFFCTEEND